MKNWENKIAENSSEEEDAYWLEEPPTKEERKLCISFNNPCFWINCRYHLRPGNNIWSKLTKMEKLEKLFSLKETCCLRLANKKGGIREQEIAHCTGLTLNIVNNAISLAKRKIRANKNLLAIKKKYYEGE